MKWKVKTKHINTNSTSYLPGFEPRAMHVKVTSFSEQLVKARNIMLIWGMEKLRHKEVFSCPGSRSHSRLPSLCLLSLRA